MAYVEALIRNEKNGAVSFGNHSLPEKKKVENFKSENDLLKVKTFKELTRLEKNDLFVYESEPGTSVFNFISDDSTVSFEVCGDKDAMITLGLSEDTEYKVFINDAESGVMKTNLSGKLSLSVELEDTESVKVKVEKV